LKHSTGNYKGILVVKNEVYEQIMVYGPAPDYETAKKLAEIAVAKIK
jgi:hypothetical protein